MNQNTTGSMNQNVNNPANPNAQPNLNRPQGQPIPGSASAQPAFSPSGSGGQQKVNNASQFIKEGNKPAPVKKKKGVMSRELVTIIGVLAIVAILYFTYNYQLNKNLEIKSQVPIAKEKIAAGTRVTEELIDYIEVPAATLNTVKAVTNADQIIGKYVNYDTIIPANSFFYENVLSATDNSPNSIFKDLLEKEAAIMIDVNLESTYANSIMPGDIVDIYADAIVAKKDGKVEYVTGPLVTAAKVLAVVDSGGENVFADHENKGTPAYFIFTLEREVIQLIRKAQKLASSEYSMSIYPVVDGQTYNGKEATAINHSQIEDLINSATINVKNNNG